MVILPYELFSYQIFLKNKAFFQGKLLSGNETDIEIEAFAGRQIIAQKDIDQLKPGYRGAAACVRLRGKEENCSFYILYIDQNLFYLSKDLSQEDYTKIKHRNIMEFHLKTPGPMLRNSIFQPDSYWQIQKVGQEELLIRIQQVDEQRIIGVDKFGKKFEVFFSSTSSFYFRKDFVKFRWSDYRNLFPGYSQYYYRNSSTKLWVFSSLFFLTTSGAVLYRQNAQKSLQEVSYFPLPAGFLLYRNRRQNSQFQRYDRYYRGSLLLLSGLYLFHAYDLYQIDQLENSSQPQIEISQKTTYFFSQQKEANFQFSWYHHF